VPERTDEGQAPGVRRPAPERIEDRVVNALEGRIGALVALVQDLSLRLPVGSVLPPSPTGSTVMMTEAAYSDSDGYTSEADTIQSDETEL